MAKSDFIAAQVTSIQAAQAQALTDGLGATWDESATEQKSSDGTLTQGDLDAAVAAATAPLNAQIAALTTKDASDVQALADAQAQAATALAAVQQSLSDMTAKEQLEEGLVSGLQGSISNLQTSLDAIKAAVSAVLNPPAAPSS